MLAGFRWINLGENLTGTLNPTTFPWEQSYWNFWNTTTTNNLYGFQIGADGKLWERGRFSIDGLVKAGIFDNNAEQTTEVSVLTRNKYGRRLRPTTPPSWRNRLAVQVSSHPAASLRAGTKPSGCKALLGPRTNLGHLLLLLIPKTVQALGVNCGSGVFYHGATAGLEYSF